MVSRKMVLLHHTGLWVTSIGFDVTLNFIGGGRGNLNRKLQLTFFFPLSVLSSCSHTFIAASKDDNFFERVAI